MPDNKLPTRRLRVFLRDFRMVEASISAAEGQSLASYFSHRKSYVNLQGARWASTNENVRHAVLKVEQVLWAAALDNDIPLVNAMGTNPPRAVEIHLEGGLLLRAGLAIGDGQRLSDYLESQAQFIPMRNAELLRSGRPPKDVNLALGDIVLNQAAIQAVWEVKAQAAPSEEPVAAVSSAE
jgi:hypothetical protein